MNIVLLFDEGEPIYSADTVIVWVITVLEVSVTPLKFAVDEVFLVSLLNPLHFLCQAKQERVGEHLLIHEVVDASR